MRSAAKKRVQLDARGGLCYQAIIEMPRKVRQLIADLERAGFVNRGGKGSHRNYVHPSGQVVTVCGQKGEDAKHYLEKQARLAIEAVTHESK